MSGHRRTTLERAYELARSGECSDLAEIRKRLKAENFDDVHGQLSGETLKRDLARLCSAGQGKEPPTPRGRPKRASPVLFVAADPFFSAGLDDRS
jgi:hypothetical protein